MSERNKCCDIKSESIVTDENSMVQEGLICYCFNHSKKELYEAIQSKKEQEVIEDIKSKMVEPGCFCKTSNPSGKCCLGDIKKFIKAYKE